MNRRALGDPPRHTPLPGNTSGMTHSPVWAQAESREGRREQPDAVPDCALVHGENLPVTGHMQLGWSRAHVPHPDTDTVRTKPHPPMLGLAHTLLSGQSRLLASSCFLLENLQLFHFNQAVRQQSISVTSECWPKIVLLKYPQ